MDLVVGASESTVKSLLGKLGSLLAQEYTLIRGVAGNLQYINDELTTMQSFLRDLGEAGDSRGRGHDHQIGLDEADPRPHLRHRGLRRRLGPPHPRPALRHVLLLSS